MYYYDIYQILYYIYYRNDLQDDQAIVVEMYSTVLMDDDIGIVLIYRFL